MHKIFIKNSLFILIATLLSACSTTSFKDLFSNYNQQMHGVKQAQQQGHFQQAIKEIPTRSHDDGSYSLSMLEKARLEYLANNNEQSQKDFALVYQLIQQAQYAAKIELSRGVENVAAIISNDNATRYDIPLYEQSMLHSYQALNYLTQQDLSGALVEIRRANLVQEKALKNNVKSLYRYQEQMKAQDFSMNGLTKQYPAMNDVIGKVKNGFQNAYTFYLSALLYEVVGQSNDAYIDYKKALEIYPDNSYLQHDVWRLANTLNMTNDIAIFKERLAQTITNKSDEKNQGQLVIIAENGIVATKQEISLNLPIYTSHNDMRFYSVALPNYQNVQRTYSPLKLTYQGSSYQSEEIVRLQSLAAKQLKDQLPIIITRQITRLIAKEKIRKTIERKNGELGNIFANIYNIATEKADTRSWSTLPDSIDILRLNLPAGEHEITLSMRGNNQPLNIKIRPNKITLIKLTAIGAYSHYHTFNL